MKKLWFIALLLPLLAACSGKASDKEPGFIVQVSLGGWNHPNYPAAKIIDRLEAVGSKINVEKVIIGWSLDDETYLQVGKYLHDKGIQMLLWLPVFAETEEVCDNEMALDLWGNVPSDFQLVHGEGFRFTCPTSEHNIANIISLYEEYFSDCGFDGVFLDRIRTQSFVSGVGGVLNCCCDECAAHFKELGVDLDEVRAAWEAKGDKFLSVTSYSPLEGFTFEDPLAAAFFQAKGKIVSGSVAYIADYFRNKGLTVGMDLYAPLMAQFVGQDYALLAEHTDFIKPMLYRVTYAPAGIAFEYELLKKSIPEADGYPDFEMDVAFLDGQLDAMAALPCDKYPGIEINYRKNVAPTSPEYVVESLRTVLNHHFNGAVLSWNIMQAPDTHIECLSEFQDK